MKGAVITIFLTTCNIAMTCNAISVRNTPNADTTVYVSPGINYGANPVPHLDTSQADLSANPPPPVDETPIPTYVDTSEAPQDFDLTPNVPADVPVDSGTVVPIDYDASTTSNNSNTIDNNPEPLPASVSYNDNTANDNNNNNIDNTTSDTTSGNATPSP